MLLPGRRVVEMERGSGQGTAEKKELLIVDDVKLFLQLTKTMFNRKEYIIHTAASGRQAIEMAKEKNPDLILLDLSMPEVDGAEVCHHIRSQPDTMDIPVIMVTSETSEEARRRCLYAGCDDFISKPVRLDVINQAVEKQLGGHKRNYRRKDIVLPCLLEDGRDQLLTNIRTLSVGGAYVQVDTPPLPGSDHLLRFYLPDTRDNISIKALARWNRLIPHRRPAGSGFEFVGIEEEDLQRLNRWAETGKDN